MAPGEVLIFQTLGLIAVTTCLFLITSGIPYLTFWVWRPRSWEKIRLASPGGRAETPKALKEASLSFANLMVYIYPYLIVSAIELTTGHTARYARISDHGWIYFLFSIGFILLIIDAHFFWTHRWFHLSGSRAHQVHHQFKSPTPWGGFAFHAWESFLLALPYVPLMLFVPWHPLAILFTQTLAMTYNAYLHLGYEPVPRRVRTRAPGKWFMTASHHCGHHRDQRFNFGLYFNYWDRLLGSERKDFANERRAQFQ